MSEIQLAAKISPYVFPRCSRLSPFRALPRSVPTANTARSHVRRRELGVRCIFVQNRSEIPQLNETNTSKRALFYLPFLAVCDSLPSYSAEDLDVDLESVSDEADGFTIQIPKGWYRGEGEIKAGDGAIGAAATRRALAWFPEAEASDVNVTLVITNTAADYMSLGSFGSAVDFGTNLVNSMDKSYLLRAPKWARKGVSDDQVQVARLLDAKEMNKGYMIEYTVRNPSISDKHFLSFVTLGFNGRYNRLYTVTAQCPEDRLPAYESAFRSICKSFRPPPSA
uniref:Photosystem ii reaction center family protein isoform 1 n=1 Tax=Tetraselmis sp. GSL018 TaxID=582737 RepID=A0A061S3L6_9CHLO